ncbi:hypothetical protein EUTSA_v10002830mg [Eutrema salsugineum]|uniref:Glycine-rich protein n=1 Tax=Eutrema salsugineum TaxID=72664 RepID=V4L0V4_EUTSA|nr:glycine-rich protein 5 [Eutrema salsugineum]ESQ37259.1 hypothetical protein EUTSA_v10002830mg [Eutrema salsugineum]
MAMRFSSSLTNLVLLFAATLLLVQASARNLQESQTPLPLHGATAPTKAESPTVNAPLEDRKNFIVGGAAGIGGFMGMPGGGSSGTGLTLPLPTGTPPLLGGSFGGLGGAMGFPGGEANGGGSVPRSGSGLVSP